MKKKHKHKKKNGTPKPPQTESAKVLKVKAPESQEPDANGGEVESKVVVFDTPAYPIQFAAFDGRKFRIPSFFNTLAKLITTPSHIPRILVEHRALYKIYHYVGATDMEVGWLGVAKITARGNIHLSDVFLVSQEVGYGHSALSTEGMSDLTMELLAQEGGEDIVNNIRHWGHSHGNGGVHPSGQDDQQMQSFRDMGADFYVRGIFNRGGDVGFSVYNWKRNIEYHNVPWQLTGELLTEKEVAMLRENIRAEMLEKVYTHTPQIRRTLHVQPTVVPPPASNEAEENEAFERVRQNQVRRQSPFAWRRDWWRWPGS